VTKCDRYYDSLVSPERAAQARDVGKKAYLLGELGWNDDTFATPEDLRRYLHELAAEPAVREGFRVLGFCRVLGFRGLGFRVLGLRKIVRFCRVFRVVLGSRV
jgi:hypothetical protein